MVTYHIMDAISNEEYLSLKMKYQNTIQTSAWEALTPKGVFISLIIDTRSRL